MRIAIVILALFAFGCDQQSQASRSRAPLPSSVDGSGIVKGSIKFGGTAPKMSPISAKDKCCQGEPLIYEETVVVNPNQTLKNVFVYLENAPATDGTIKPAELIDQARCAYVPHVVGVQVGQPLRVRSSDPTLHNVHYIPQLNPAANLSMTAAGAEKTVSFDYAEFVRLKCDVHPWMTGWVGVFEHPFFSITREMGEFEIKGIPAGTYTLVAWHELYGKQKQTVTIVGDQPIEMTFTFGKSSAVTG